MGARKGRWLEWGRAVDRYRDGCALSAPHGGPATDGSILDRCDLYLLGLGGQGPFTKGNDQLGRIIAEGV